MEPVIFSPIFQNAPTLPAATYITQGDYAGVNWDDTYKRLCVFAHLISSKMPDVFDGISVEDLVNDIFVRLFESPNQLSWNPKKGTLSRFLMGVLKHKVLDRLRRDAKRVGSLDDPNFKLPPSRFLAHPTVENGVLGAIEGDQPLQELVSVAERVSSGEL